MNRSITLYCQEGGSDKEYRLFLRQARPEEGDGWLVEYANGPRGAVMRAKRKTPEPVTLAQAEAEYSSVLKSKLKKGYHEGEQGQAYSSSEFDGRASDHRQQLLTAISFERAQELLAAPEWVLQEKANGERRAVEVRQSGEVRGINKLGIYTPVPAAWTEAFAGLAAKGDLLLDGEQVGEQLYVFDLLQLAGHDLRSLTAFYRLRCLEAFGASPPVKAVDGLLRVLPVAWSPAAKLEAARRIEAASGEGYVLKHADAPYEAGRSPLALKFKFVESVTAIVIARNAQRSVKIGLLDAAGCLVDLGNVTIPANQEVPQPGDLAEVQYLYFNPGGAFEQPVYLRPREDVDRSECHFGQVSRLKPGVEMPAHLWLAPEEAGDADDRPRMAA